MPENRWDKFALENACDCICFNYRGDPKAFWESGQRQCAEILSEVNAYLPGRKCALEIGCGVGRLLIPMTRHFERGRGVDISRVMLDRLLQHAAEQGAGERIQAFLPDQHWYEGKVDLVYSLIAFQHVDSWEEIRFYIAQSARCLSQGGAAYLHFDTRPENFFYRLKNALPDFMLPVSWKRKVRRIRRPRRDLLALFKENGFVCRKELFPNTTDHVFLLQKV